MGGWIRLSCCLLALGCDSSDGPWNVDAPSAIDASITRDAPGDAIRGELPPRDTRLVDLEDAQRVGFCEVVVDIADTDRNIDCGTGTTISIEDPTHMECVIDLEQLASGRPNCPATAGQYEDCLRALAAATDMELCEGFPEVCAPMFVSTCQQ